MNLIFIKSVTWEESFLSWAKDEANLPHWVKHYKERGFDSWEEWRTDSIKDLGPKQLEWNLYQIKNPLETISDFYAGPFRSWKKKYYGDNAIIQFKELAKNPDLQQGTYVNNLIKTFPKESTLIGLNKDEKIIIVDGMHRCCALAVAYQKNITIETKLFIILADYLEELPVLGQVNSPT